MIYFLILIIFSPENPYIFLKWDFAEKLVKLMIKKIIGSKRTPMVYKYLNCNRSYIIFLIEIL